MTVNRSTSPQGRVLTNPRYLRLWIGQIISNLGDQVAYMGLAFMILYQLNGTALDIGKMTIAASIPTLLLGPVAGVFVDRWSRRWVMTVADIIRGLIYVAMPFATSLTWVYVGIFAASVMSRFFYPAKSAILPNIVDADDLLVANALSQTTSSIIAVIGPGLGATMAGFLGVKVTLFANAASFFISALFIVSIRLTETLAVQRAAANVSAGLRAVWSQLAEGMRFIVGNQVVRFYTGMFALFLLFIGGLNVVFLPFMKDVLGLSISTIGFIESTQAIGGIAGALIVAAIGARLKSRTLIIGALASIGLEVALMGVNRLIPAAFMITALIGISNTAVNIPFSTEMMRTIPDQMRGRAFGCFGSLTEGAALVSMAVLPMLSVTLGLEPVIVTCGIAVIAIGAAALWLAPQLQQPSATATAPSE